MHLGTLIRQIGLWLTAVAVWSVSAQGAQTNGLRIFEQPQAALEAARRSCQPIVLHFYDSQTWTYAGRGQYVSPQDRIRVFYLDNPKIRDDALSKAVVLLLPMQRWQTEARDLGVHSHEGLASLSPFELRSVDASEKWGGLVFR